MKAHCENAMAIAEFLENHQKVEKVIYPGLKSFSQHDLARKQMKGYGGMVTFFLKGGLEESTKFLENTKLFSLAIMTHASVPAGQRKTGN
ncbi:MAG: PLP-dependent transferase [Bacteroidales bacterium]